MEKQKLNEKLINNFGIIGEESGGSRSSNKPNDFSYIKNKLEQNISNINMKNIIFNNDKEEKNEKVNNQKNTNSIKKLNSPLKFSKYSSEVTGTNINYTQYSSHSNIKSRYLLIVSILFTSLSFLFIKILYYSHYDTLHSDNTLNFFCGIFLFIYSLIFLKVDNIDFSQKKNFNKSEFDYFLMRSILGFLANLFTIKALNNMRLISSSTLFCLSPVMTTFIEMKKLREKFKQVDKICLIGSIITFVLFIIQDFSYSLSSSVVFFYDSFSGVIYSSIAVGLNCINSLIDKKICYDFHSYSILFMTGAVSITLSPILMSFANDQFYMTTKNLVLFFLFGSSCFFAFYFNQKTIEANPLLVNSNLRCCIILLSYMFSQYILDEPFTHFDIFCTSIVILINFFMRLRAEECENNDETENL